MTTKLIYLEDDEVLASVTVRALKKRGFELIHFCNLKEARNYKEFSQCSHALLDLKLEDGNSLSFISELINENPDIKIVVLTGYSSIATAVQAIKFGALNYLAKPATIDQILKAFESVQDEMDKDADDLIEDVSLKRLEWEKIQHVLTENNGNISATARQLKMHRRTLQRKLNKKPVSE